VLVGVILVVVLGIVSVTRTSTDLLPSMDLPFSAVFTTYIGATPEQVERDISIPLEASLSTLSGIQNIQSISSEHVSVIILEFTGETNMDSASLEIREALDAMTLPEGSARPMTMRMNPNMLPIMTLDVHMEGVSIDELSIFVRDIVSPAIESVPGVAAVSLTGMVQNQLHVVLRDEYIDNANLQILAAMEYMRANPEDIIMAQVDQIAEMRMMELMQGGMPAEAANTQLQMELPAISETVALEMMAAMGSAGEVVDNGSAIGIPAYMITVETISAILTAQNFSMPAGVIIDDGMEYMVRVGERFESLDEIKDMLIFDPAQMGLAGVPPIRLSDVASVFVADDSHLSFTQINGNDTIMLTIQGQSEFSTADVTNAVRDRMGQLEAEHPGLGFTVMMDQGNMIGMMIDSIFSNLIIGGILAMLVLFLFLRDYRPTLIVAVSIPASLLLAFTLMYFTGISLNMMSMGGLALTVGMLVDNSVAVMENIFRLKAKGYQSAAKASVAGTKQVAGAIMAATLTTSAVFLPIIFTGGITRQLFQDFALTITFSLVASLIIALTVVPAASSVMLKKVKKEQEGKLFSRFVDGYEKLLRLSLRFRWAVLAFAVVAFVASLWAIGGQGMEMFPAMDSAQVSATAQMPEDSTFEDTVATAERLSAYILAIDDVEVVSIGIGGGGGMFAMMGMGGRGNNTTINMDVLLADDRTISSSQLNAQIRDIAEGLGLDADVAAGDGGMGMMGGDAISLRVEGTKLDDMRDSAIALAALVNSAPGTTNVTDLTQDAIQELRVSVDKDAAMAHGLTVAQVFMITMDALSADERSVNMNLSGRQYEIIITDGDFVAPNKEDIRNMLIPTVGGYVLLSDIAEVHEDVGFSAINRMNRTRFVNITADLEEGFNVTLVNNEITDLLEDFVPVGDSRVVVGGEAEAIAEAFGDLAMMLALGILFVYLIMVAQFQSIKSPFIILFAIPLAFTGGFAALMIAGMPLSMMAMVGLILLAGVSINNGIVLVSRITQERWEGVAKTDAIVDAGRKRLRPILMTAISTIFAMSVMALGIGDGMEMMQPMAVATIGGLIYATFMTLFVVPIIYDLMHKDKDITLEDLDSPEEVEV